MKLGRYEETVRARHRLYKYRFEEQTCRRSLAATTKRKLVCTGCGYLEEYAELPDIEELDKIAGTDNESSVFNWLNQAPPSDSPYR